MAWGQPHEAGPGTTAQMEAAHAALDALDIDQGTLASRAMDVAEEVRRWRILTDQSLSFRDLEIKIRDGQLRMHAVGADEGGTAAMRWVAALLLHVMLGDDNEEPANYRAIEWEMSPGHLPVDETSFEKIRVCAEIIRDGRKSSHELRCEMESKFDIHGDGPCALCGRSPSAGYASTYHNGQQVWLCHLGGDARTCYWKWTILHERPPESVDA